MSPCQRHIWHVFRLWRGAKSLETAPKPHHTQTRTQGARLRGEVRTLTSFQRAGDEPQSTNHSHGTFPLLPSWGEQNCALMNSILLGCLRRCQMASHSYDANDGNLMLIWLARPKTSVSLERWQKGEIMRHSVRRASVFLNTERQESKHQRFGKKGIWTDRQEIFISSKVLLRQLKVMFQHLSLLRNPALNQG